MGKKVCGKCKKKLGPESFYANLRRSDGLHYHCKECVRAYARAYRLAHLDRVREVSREWREFNAEHVRKYNAAYYKANRARIIAQRKARKVEV